MNIPVEKTASDPKRVVPEGSLAAEITAHTGLDPNSHDHALIRELDVPLSDRMDAVREPLSPPPHEQTEREAVEAWENEGDPN